MKKGQKMLQKALELNKILYSDIATDKKNIAYQEYLSLIKQAAYKGNFLAQFEYAQTFEEINYLGLNPAPNYSKAVYWYTKASEGNIAESLNSLATLYESGKGCKQDVVKAHKLYKKAAELGSSSGKKNYKLLTKQLAK